MTFLKWLAALIIDKLLTKLIEFGKELLQKKSEQIEDRKDSAELIEKVKNAKTDQEIDDALDDLSKRR